MKCKHKNTHLSSGGVYKFCDDCGATSKRMDTSNQKWDEWHTCELCCPRLYTGSTISEVQEAVGKVVP